MTEYTHRAILVVPASEQEHANQLALQLDPLGGEYTFTIPLNASGAPGDPPTHFWCAAAMRAETWAQVQALLPQVAGAQLFEWDVDLEPGKPDQVLSQLGLQRIIPLEPP